MVAFKTRVLDLMKELMNLMIIHLWYLPLMPLECMTTVAVSYRKERKMNLRIRCEN